MFQKDQSYYYFFNSKSSQGEISLEEIAAGFESNNPAFNCHTWIRGFKSLYWSTLEYTKEIACILDWDFIDENGKKISGTRGDALIELYYRAALKEDAQVKLSHGFEWRPFKHTVLFENGMCENNGKFYGIAACRPSWRNKLASTIDFICYSLLPFVPLYFLEAEVGFLFFFLNLFCPIVSSFLSALFIRSFGRTIGGKVSSLYILTSQGEKLTFTKAFIRQWHASIIRHKQKWVLYHPSSKGSLYPYGAIEWDRKQGYVVAFSSSEKKFIRHLESKWLHQRQQ